MVSIHNRAQFFINLSEETVAYRIADTFKKGERLALKLQQSTENSNNTSLS